jgi:hypothetical protein
MRRHGVIPVHIGCLPMLGRPSCDGSFSRITGDHDSRLVEKAGIAPNQPTSPGDAPLWVKMTGGQASLFKPLHTGYHITFDAHC